MTQKAKYLTDAESYRGGDSGCKEATDYLEGLYGSGHPSKCLECPFYPKKCLLMKRKKPGRKKGVKYERDGKTNSEMAKTEDHSGQYNRNFFYNSARADAVLGVSLRVMK